MADLPAVRDSYFRDTLVVLAREIAVDVQDLQTILKTNQITPEMWLDIQNNPHFQQLLTSEIQAWNSALNTEQRTKLKAAALIEEFLPEANKRLHNTAELLSAKVELAKLIARIAGIGVSGAGIEGGAEKFSVTINLGADSSLKFEGKSPMKTIDAVPLE